MERIQTLVVGAGVVGLACARALARTGREVVIAEAAAGFGTGTSSRNSEVLHAGIYYPLGSLKARHCIQGRRALLSYCEERRIAHRICGKLVVATSEDQRADLARIAAHAERSGVTLRPLTGEEARFMEPELSCIAALHSPGTAVIDSHGLMEALLADAVDAGAVLALRTRIRPGGRLLPSGGVTAEMATTSDEGGAGDGGAATGAEAFRCEALEVVNCAGLAAPRVARYLGAQEVEIPIAHFCRGSYYSLQGAGPASRPFSRLIYPIPERNTSGLGIHATVDLAGQVRFGPDVEWLPRSLASGRSVDEAAYDEREAAVAYAVDTSRSRAFYGEVRRYWPGLPDGALVADYSGIRPKLSGPGEPAADFQMVSHGVLGSDDRPSLVSLFGIESPGLTSCLSLAEEVVSRLGPPPSPMR